MLLMMLALVVGVAKFHSPRGLLRFLGHQLSTQSAENMLPGLAQIKRLDQVVRQITPTGKLISLEERLAPLGWFCCHMERPLM